MLIDNSESRDVCCRVQRLQSSLTELTIDELRKAATLIECLIEEREDELSKQS